MGVAIRLISSAEEQSTLSKISCSRRYSVLNSQTVRLMAHIKMQPPLAVVCTLYETGTKITKAQSLVVTMEISISDRLAETTSDEAHFRLQMPLTRTVFWQVAATTLYSMIEMTKQELRLTM